MAPSEGELLRSTGEVIEYLVHHIISRLPQIYDYSANHVRTLLHVVIQALQSLQPLIQEEYVEAITFAIAA